MKDHRPLTSDDPKNKPGLRLVSETEETNEGAEDFHPDPVNDEGVSLQIAELEAEHRDLDLAIATVEERMPYDRISLQRMKKRKLALKDKIVTLKDKLFPDIIA
ncbi:MAG: DUF465 domain-containing protein [Parvularculaceae bacterium]